MLGFSPLASAPLADSGAIAEAAFGLDDIVAGVPTVATSTISQAHVLTSTDVTTGVPTVAASTISQVHVITPDGISSGAPTVGAPSITQIHSITLDDIVAGAPIVGPARFKWQVEPVGPETWTEQGSTDPTWTEHEAA